MNTISKKNSRAPVSENLEILRSYGLPEVLVFGDVNVINRYLDFFKAHTANGHTRSAYRNACDRFIEAMNSDEKIKTFEDLTPKKIADYIDQLKTQQLNKEKYYKPKTIKLHVSAIRAMLDWMVARGCIPTNPALSVKTDNIVQQDGSTPVLCSQNTRKLLDSIPLKNEVDYRDRALIGLMVYSLARIGTATKLRVGDYAPEGKRWWLALQEKDGKTLRMPVHTELEEYIDSYLEYAGISEDNNGWLFRSSKGRSGKLLKRQYCPKASWKMVQRRAKNAGIDTKINNHTFRATGITTYLGQGGSLEIAQKMAGHSNPVTTQLYDRRDRKVKIEAVQKIQY